MLPNGSESASLSKSTDVVYQVHEDEVADWVDENDVSNYHTFTVPYGERFHAKKIEKLCYTKDLRKLMPSHFYTNHVVELYT